MPPWVDHGIRVEYGNLPNDWIHREQGPYEGVLL